MRNIGSQNEGLYRRHFFSSLNTEILAVNNNDIRSNLHVTVTLGMEGENGDATIRMASVESYSTT